MRRRVQCAYRSSAARDAAPVFPALNIVAGVVLALTAVSASAEPARERQSQLLHLLRHDCGSCHGMRLKGGLGPPLTPEAVADKPAAVLEQAILYGRPGTPMPPWDGMLSDEEVSWLVERLRAGVRDAE
ncbi:MAG: cytochrome c [Gammaproteobacteria bacterium]|nr:cytochrome c [Gammaproteobacteria bacterium]NIR83509.1 cytochrome c [Gammaproteobacteria bacterium]NIR91431.1 cytochrome c [Gammaproteobacteria bacterium]NIU04671.1 cytochrome c [Gammaproteobacteria bacterium]NIV51713.1 cytochrome c [Gammaproteobacteria bacterium]